MKDKIVWLSLLTETLNSIAQKRTKAGQHLQNSSQSMGKQCFISTESKSPGWQHGTMVSQTVLTYICAFNLIKAGLVKLEQRCCGEEGLYGGLQPDSLGSLGCRGLSCPSISSYFPAGQRWDHHLCDHHHCLSSPSALFHGNCCSLCSPWEESLKGSEMKKNCLAYPGSSSPPKDTCQQHRWRYPVWRMCLQGSLSWWGKQQENLWQVWQDTVQPLTLVMGDAVTWQTAAGSDKTKITLMVAGGLSFSFKQIGAWDGVVWIGLETSTSKPWWQLFPLCSHLYLPPR